MTPLIDTEYLNFDVINPVDSQREIHTAIRLTCGQVDPYPKVAGGRVEQSSSLRLASSMVHDEMK